MVSDFVIANAIETQAGVEMFQTICWIIFALLAFAVITRTPKSKRAREKFADLYVIGTIRKLAKEDGIDLNDEFKQLRKLDAIENASIRTIDKQVEVELNEKINAQSQKAIDKINAEEPVDYVDYTKK